MAYVAAVGAAAVGHALAQDNAATRPATRLSSEARALRQQETAHPLSHHQGDVEEIAKVEKVNTYHVRMFAYCLDKLRSISDGEGTLLDSVMILYGSGMGDGNTHSHHNLPALLVGGGAGQLAGGRHIRYQTDTPLSNLYVTCLESLESLSSRLVTAPARRRICRTSDVRSGDFRW
jgi:hypothetical protein